jgi:hypothetical protein
VAVDDVHGTIDLKVGISYDGPLPVALVPEGPILTQTQRARLRDLGARVVRDGITGQDAVTALLMRCRRPTGRRGHRCVARGRPRPEVAVRLVLNLRDSYLPLQGPLGTGKTFTAANQILELTAASSAG